MREFIRRHWFPALLALVLAGPTTYWTLDTAPPLVIHSIKVVDRDVPRGGNLVMEYDITRVRHCRGEAQRVFVDVKDTLIPIEVYRFNEGVSRDGQPQPIGRSVIRVSAPVPFGAAPGPARYQAVLEYFCNPLQRLLDKGIVVTTPVQNFVVLEQTVSRGTPPQRIPGASAVPDPADGLKRYQPPIPTEPVKDRKS